MHHNEWLPQFKGFWILLTIWKQISHWKTLVTVSLDTSQGQRCSPVCKRWCTFRLLFKLDVLLHKTQQYGRSALCKPSRPTYYQMFYYAHHSDMDAPQYVLVDVSPDFLSYCKFYYTYHRDMDVLQYVHVDVPSDYFSNWIFYYTNHSNIDAPHYVNLDVPSRPAYYQMFYNTHHSDMDAPQYVHVDVSPDILFCWKFYYTYHRDMDVLQYVHVDVPSDYF